MAKAEDYSSDWTINGYTCPSGVGLPFQHGEKNAL